MFGSFAGWICLLSALVGQKKTFVSWLAKEERREALSIPEACNGRGSEHGAHVLRRAQLHKRD